MLFYHFGIRDKVEFMDHKYLKQRCLGRKKERTKYMKEQMYNFDFDSKQITIHKDRKSYTSMYLRSCKKIMPKGTKFFMN